MLTEPILKRKQSAADQLGKAASDLTPEDLMGAGWSPKDALKAVPMAPGVMQTKPVGKAVGVGSINLGAELAKRAGMVAGALTGATMGGPVGAAVKTAVTTGLGAATEVTPKAEVKLSAPTASPQTPAAPPPQIPQVSPFSYRPTTRTDDQILATAKARAQLLIGTQRQDAQAGFAQQQEMARQQREGLARRQASTEEMNRSQWSARGLGTSGFHAGANALSQAATVGEIGKVNTQERLAQNALQERLAQLNQLQAQSEVANYDQLLQMERQYGLQDRSQQFGEYSSNRDFGLRQQDLGSILQQRAFDLQRGQALLPGELQGQSLGNQTAALALQRGQSLLPYEVGQAQLALQRGQSLLPYEVLQARLGTEGQSIGNQTAQFSLDSARQMQPVQMQAAQLANERATLQNKMALLDYQIANDPDVGNRQQAIRAKQEAEQKMRLVEAQIAQVNAETANIGKTTPKETTPTANSVANRWGVESGHLGMTSNYSAFDNQMNQWAWAIQNGATYQDAYDYVAENRNTFLQNGVDPSAFLSVLKRKYFPNSGE